MSTDATNAGSSDLLEQIRTGYAFEGASLVLGAAVEGPEAHADLPVGLPLASLNRHGLVAGATGTGKTKTLQVMAEQLSAAGVPVFLADIKGDLSGLALPGEEGEKITERAASVGQDWRATASPVEFLRLGDKGTGVPVRATVTSFGPTLLSKVLGLTEIQESSLGLVFHYADSHGLPLVDLGDLRAVIQHLVSPEGKADLEGLGALSKATAGVILRELVTFGASADSFFGEPEFDTADLLRTTEDGLGVISCLELPSVQSDPQLFSTFLMWLLADLFNDLPEVGDPEKPELVFFLDEAHLLFKDASKSFRESIENTVRLIRSKGVGVFFVTQVPTDLPDSVLAQLGNRVQHALRAFTPNDQKALRQAARTYPHTSYDLEELLTTLGTGEAVVTVLGDDGVPTPVAHTRLRAPQSLMAPCGEERMAEVIAASELQPRYAERLDPESAYEKLMHTMEASAGPRDVAGGGAGEGAGAGVENAPQQRTDRTERADRADDDVRRTRRVEEADQGVLGQILGNRAVKSAMRSAGTAVGRELVRSLFGTRRRR